VFVSTSVSIKVQKVDDVYLHPGLEFWTYSIAKQQASVQTQLANEHTGKTTHSIILYFTGSYLKLSILEPHI